MFEGMCRYQHSSKFEEFSSIYLTKQKVVNVYECITNIFFLWLIRGRLFLQEGLMILDGILFLNLMAMTKRISIPSFMSCSVQGVSQFSYLLRLIHFIYSHCRYAQMPKEEKNKISHRSKSLALVKSHFAEARFTFDVKNF